MAKFTVPKATTTERNTVTPDAGELLFDETLNEYFGGNGSTAGGITLAASGTSNISVDGTNVVDPNFIFDNNISATVNGSNVTIDATGGGGSSSVPVFYRNMIAVNNITTTVTPQTITYETANAITDTGYSESSGTVTLATAGTYKINLCLTLKSLNTSPNPNPQLTFGGNASIPHTATILTFLGGQVSSTNLDPIRQIATYIWVIRPTGTNTTLSWGLARRGTSSGAFDLEGLGSSLTIEKIG